MLFVSLKYRNSTILALMLALGLGCSSSGGDKLTCAAGERLACSCTAGGSGFRICDLSGAYGSCDCQATLPDAGTPDAPASPDVPTDVEFQGDANSAGSPDGSAAGDGDTATLLPLYSPCLGDPECGSGFCFLYNDGKRLCTKTCASSAECPAPSTGCNAKGVCKNPM